MFSNILSRSIKNQPVQMQHRYRLNKFHEGLTISIIFLILCIMIMYGGSSELSWRLSQSILLLSLIYTLRQRMHLRRLAEDICEDNRMYSSGQQSKNKKIAS